MYHHDKEQTIPYKCDTTREEKSGGIANFRYSFRDQLLINSRIDDLRNDHMSLSSSPPLRRKEMPLYRQDSPCLSEPKDVGIEIDDEENVDDISTNENIYDIQQENILEYCYGGYMPVIEGDVLDERYEVLRKLGYGHFSTVWLCQNKTNKEYVAIKVIKASKMFSCVAKDEMKLLHCTMHKDPDHPGSKKIVQLLDDFKAKSINGIHTCMVFELMGPSLLHLLTQSDFRGVKIPGVRNIIKQVLLGLVYLHESCRIIHTDIKPENILIKVKDKHIHKLVESNERYQESGTRTPKNYVTPERWKLCDGHKSCDGNFHAGSSKDYEPLTLTRYNSYPNDVAMDELANYQERHLRKLELQGPIWIDPNIEVKIADLGNACWEDLHFTEDIQTKQYRALEVILGADYSFPADIWSLGCLTFEMATGEYLFNPKPYGNYTSDEDHLGLIWEVLDGIPRYITQRGIKASTFFDSEGDLRHIEKTKLKIWKVEDVLVEKYYWKRVDAIPFASFIQAMIEPDPELRITAAAALEHQWVKDVSDNS